MAEVMDAWLRRFVSEAIKPVFGLLGDSLLATPRLDQMPRVRQLWTGALVVANTCLVLLVVIAGVTLMGNPTVQAAYTVKDIAPRLVTGVVLANMSLLLIGKAIAAANALAAALLGPGVDPGKATASIKTLLTHVLAGSFGAFVAWVVMAAVVLAALLGLVYLLRLVVTVALIAVAPLALMCHCLPQTEHLARLWWRGLAGVLAIQVAQALVVITAMRVWFDSNWYAHLFLPIARGMADLWIVVGLLYVLVRIPAWVTRWVWQGSGASPIARTANVVVAAVVTRRVTGALTAANRHHSSRRGAPTTTGKGGAR